MNNFVQSRILPLAVVSAAAILTGTAPAHALTWNFTASSSGSTGTGSFTYSGSGDGTFTVTSLNYTETSPNSGSTYVLDASPASGNIGPTSPGIDQVLVSGGLITAYNLYAVNSAASGLNYGRFFTSNVFGFAGVGGGTYGSSGGASSGNGTNTFTPGTSSAVPFEVPLGSTIPVTGSLLGLAVLRKARKPSNNLATTVTEKVN